MKKIYFLGALLATTLSFGQVTDDFSGTGLLTANGWTTHSGTTGQLTIAPGSLSYSGITNSGNKIALVAGNSEDVNRSVGTAITGVSYFSTIVNFPNVTGLTTTGDYSMALSSTIGTTGVTALYGRLTFKTGSVADTFNVGVVNTSGTGTAANFIATDFPIGVPVFVVVKYDRSNNTAYLFLNPVLNTTEPAPALTNATGATAAPTQLAGIVLRQVGSAAAGSGNVEYDTVRVSDNWAFVTSGVLSRNSFDAISGLKIYPNPAKNLLNITSDSFEAKTVAIYNVLGKVVLSANVTNAPVNVANLAKGVYVVKVTEEGKTATRKLVIE